MTYQIYFLQNHIDANLEIPEFDIFLSSMKRQTLIVLLLFAYSTEKVQYHYLETQKKTVFLSKLPFHAKYQPDAARDN